MATPLAALVKNRSERLEYLNRLIELTEIERRQLDADEAEDLAATTAQWKDTAEKLMELDADYNKAAKEIGEFPDSAESQKVADLNEQGHVLLKSLALAHDQVRGLADSKIASYKANLKNVQMDNARTMSYVNPYAALSESIYLDKKQ